MYKECRKEYDYVLKGCYLQNYNKHYNRYKSLKHNNKWHDEVIDYELKCCCLYEWEGKWD